MTKPIVTIRHKVTLDPDGAFELVPAIDPTFMKIMGRLFPAFASYTKAENGYSAFAYEKGKVRPAFIGSFGGMTLQSIRKNPTLPRGDDRFIRALLGGLHLDGYKHHSSVCSAKNYGTLSLWKKLGLGAKLDARGKARSAPGTLTARGLLDDLRREASEDYAEHRIIAQRMLDSMDDMFPSPDRDTMISRTGGLSYRLNVTLS